MLRIENCRERIARLLAHMEANRLEAVILGNPKTVYYFTGALVDAGAAQAFALAAGGQSLLVTNQEPPRCAAERVQLYTAYTLERPFSRCTMNAEAAEWLRAFLGPGRGEAGVDFEYLDAGMVRAAGERPLRNITPALEEMRRRKDPDELESMRATTRLTETAYAALKPRLEPGMTECQAYLVLYEALVGAAGTSVDFKGDFACGLRAIRGGGPPTTRKLEAGDLYILDLFPTWEGYMCDLCRTFAVGEPSQLQRDAWAHVLEGHKIAQQMIRPGVKGRAVYEALRAHLDRFTPAKGSFHHHAGHGLGMDGWEYPWLTPGSDQVIQEGEVIACEPGLYSEELRGGIRLEHNYLVGAESVTSLDSFPMDL